MTEQLEALPVSSLRQRRRFPDASSDVLEGLIRVGSETLQLPGGEDFLFVTYTYALQAGEAWSTLTPGSRRS